MENVIKNLDEIVLEIERIRNTNNITYPVEILAASKTRDIGTLLELNKDGRVKVYGENRVQEFIEKYSDELTWDIIGQLQTNKVKYVVGKVRYIQSLDRTALAEEIEKQASKRDIIQKCLVEVNTGAEEAKGGLLLNEVESFIKTVTEQYKHIKICGLMAVAPRRIEEEELRGLFRSVRALYSELKDEYGFEVLSMGMSEDYRIAIECGSTSVRLGRILFGERR